MSPAQRLDLKAGPVSSTVPRVGMGTRRSPVQLEAVGDRSLNSALPVKGPGGVTVASLADPLEGEMVKSPGSPRTRVLAVNSTPCSRRQYSAVNSTMRGGSPFSATGMLHTKKDTFWFPA